jgi:cytochrome c peroxidase
VCIAALAVLCACPRKPPKPVAKRYIIEIPLHFPTILNEPLDNLTTVEGVELGRHLFYEGRLSGRQELDSMMSCFSCHRQGNAFESGMNNPFYDNKSGRMFGLTGIKTPNAMLPLINLVFQHDGYLWNGMIHSSNQNLGHANYGVPAQEPYNQKNLEAFVWMMIAAPHEIHGTIEKSVNAIASLPKYPPMFEAAFGTHEVTIDRICKAIAQFVRTLISADSKFDKFLQHKVQLTDDEMAGYILFSTERADCFHCHGGDGNILFSTYGYSNNGLDTEHNDPRDRFFVTQNSQDKGKYKIPTLRNIALTAPYMHDGRFTTLEEVIDFYSEGLMWSQTIDPLMKQIRQGGVQLTPREKRQLIAFLHTLTDSTFITNPKFSNPNN